MGTTATITEALVQGNLSHDEIAELFHITEDEVKSVALAFDDKLMDDNTTEEEFQEWCDATDSNYTA